MMKPFIIDSTTGQLLLVFSKEQLDTIKLSPSRFCDEMEKRGMYGVIGFETLLIFENENGNITPKTLVQMHFKKCKDYSSADIEDIMSCYKAVINEHYKKI